MQRNAPKQASKTKIGAPQPASFAPSIAGSRFNCPADGRSIARTRGDEDHPASKGYLCNKASRLSYYQDRANRLLSPMRRRPDGTYEEVAWETAIQEIAAKLTAVRDAHGGESIFYYGGGGQGNHLPGAYARTSTGPLGVKYRSNALAQEKTGEFWVADRMFGGWPHGDFEHAEVAVFLGKNPWQSHGVHRARAAIREIAKDPGRTLIVIDPKRTESADLADIHLAVKPARDAWLLAGMAAVIVQEGLVNEAWLARHASGLAEVESTLAGIDVADCAAKSGIDEAVIRSTAPPDRRRQQRRRAGGPGRADESPLHPGLLSATPDLGADWQLRTPRHPLHPQGPWPHQRWPGERRPARWPGAA